VIDAIEIKHTGQEFGIDSINITTAEPFPDAASRIAQQRAAGLYLNSEYWHHRRIQDFCNARSVLPKARSIIVACQCYLTNEDITEGTPGHPHGIVARYTWRNYYKDLRQRLRNLAAVLKNKHSADCAVYVNGDLAEKPIARRSGIGYYGKHSIIINKQFGSWTVLGEIVTDAEIAPDTPSHENCGACTTCIESCPTQAIIEPYIIDRRLCIQALTNWYGVLPDSIASAWGNRLYGCTTCQDVCPANRAVIALPPRTDTGYVGSAVPLLELLSMRETQYRSTYADNQITARWVDFRAIKRNATIALGNIRDPKTLPVLQTLAKNNDEVIARSAMWAIDNF
jgi:epoxyqueuosine reductase